MIGQCHTAKQWQKLSRSCFNFQLIITCKSATKCDQINRPIETLLGQVVLLLLLWRFSSQTCLSDQIYLLEQQSRTWRLTEPSKKDLLYPRYIVNHEVTKTVNTRVSTYNHVSLKWFLYLGCLVGIQAVWGLINPLFYSTFNFIASMT